MTKRLSGHGQTAVEFALVAPPLIALLLGIINWHRLPQLGVNSIDLVN